MPMLCEPEINSWYRDNAGKIFQVVALDDADSAVEVQHFGGEIEAFPLGSWYGAELESIDAPEDWSGALDDVSRDDLGDTGMATHPEVWSGPWEEIDRAD